MKSKWFDLRRLYESFDVDSSCVIDITKWILHLLSSWSSYVNRSTRRFITKGSHLCCGNFRLMISNRLYSLWSRRNTFFLNSKIRIYVSYHEWFWIWNLRRTSRLSFFDDFWVSCHWAYEESWMTTSWIVLKWAYLLKRTAYFSSWSRT